MRKLLTWILQITVLTGVASKVTIDYKEGVSSGVEFYRNVIRGPEKDHFSICSSESACSLLSGDKPLWSSDQLNTALIHSSPLYKKSLVCGFVTKILDLSSGVLVERDTVPSKIFKCVYSIGENWVCLDGDIGQYMVYNVKNESKVLSFESSLGASLQYMSDKGCSAIDSGKIFCLDLNGVLKPVIDLDKADAGGLETYGGGFDFTEGEAAGCSSDRDLMMVYSVSPLEVKIGDPKSGVMKVGWKKDGVFGLGISRGDLRMGVVFLPNGINTRIFKVYDGEEVASLKTVHSFEFSEIENQVYYVDFSDNIYKIGELGYDLGFENCDDFRFGIEECYKCSEGYEMIFQNGKALRCQVKPEVPEENNEEVEESQEPGRFFMNNEYVVDTSSSLDLIFVQLTQFYNRTEEETLRLVNATFNGSLEGHVFVTHQNDSSWGVEDFMDFTVVESVEEWGAAKLPIMVDYKRSMEGFLGDFFLVKNISVVNASRILQSSSIGNSSVVYVPSYWKMSGNFQIFFMVIFDFTKLIITCLQLFLVIVRPFWKRFGDKKYEILWIPVASYYIFLALGSIPGKLGGFLDQIQTEQLKSLQKIFFIDPQVIFSAEFYSKFKISNLQKFRISDYSPSILQENIPELSFITLGLIILALSLKFKSLRGTSSTFQSGFLLSYSLPIALTTGVTAFSIIAGGFVTSYSFISFGLSLVILCYMFWALKRIGSRVLLLDMGICLCLGIFCSISVLSCLSAAGILALQIWMKKGQGKNMEGKADLGNYERKLSKIEIADKALKLVMALVLAVLSFLMPIFSLMQVQISTFFVTIILLSDLASIYIEMWYCYRLIRVAKPQKIGKKKEVNIDLEIANAHVGDEKREIEVIKTDRKKNYEIDIEKKKTDDDDLRSEIVVKSSHRNLSDLFDKIGFEDKKAENDKQVVYELPDVDSGKYVSRGTMTNDRF